MQSASIVILEDDARRRDEMVRVLQAAGYLLPRFFLTAPDAIAAIESTGFTAKLISLDQDLEPAEPLVDPGTGRNVAHCLATRFAESEPLGPIIIHSTNYYAALGMEAELVDGGWRVERIAPYDDLAWIREAWLPLVEQLIAEAGRAQ